MSQQNPLANPVPQEAPQGATGPAGPEAVPPLSAGHLTPSDPPLTEENFKLLWDDLYFQKKEVSLQKREVSLLATQADRVGTIVVAGFVILTFTVILALGALFYEEIRDNTTHDELRDEIDRLRDEKRSPVILLPRNCHTRIASTTWSCRE